MPRYGLLLVALTSLVVSLACVVAAARADLAPPAIAVPPAVTNSSTISLTGTASTGATVRLYEGATEVAATAAPGGGWSVTLTGVPEGTHTYVARATDADGTGSADSAPVTVRVDKQPPVATIASGPTGRITSTAISYSFNADEAATFTCRLTGPGHNLGARPCTSPMGYAELTAGEYVFDVVATDTAGNVSAPVSRTFDVDPATPVDPSPVAAYGFEDAVGSTTAGDSSARGNTGTIVGGATRVAGKVGSAISFDGVNDRIRIPDAPSLNLASGMTLEAWVNPSATNGSRAAIVKERKVLASYGLQATANPSAFTSTDGVTGSVQHSSALPTNAWSHLAATFDGATLRLFVNGVQVATTTQSSGPLVPGDGPLSIGGSGLKSEWFSGLIDEVRVYDRALTAAEIQSDMITPVGSPASTPAPPQAGKVGSWTAPKNWPLVAVHASMLSNGKVVAWDAFSAAMNSEHVWNPTTEVFEEAPSGINLFCAGHVLLPDGRLFVAGGHELAYVGLRDTLLFNPLTGAWTAGPDMARGRWYPTTTTLPDGRVLIVSGDGIVASNHPFFVRPSETIPEIYDPKTNRITALPQAGRLMPLYPYMFVAPDGRVVDAGPDGTTRLLDVNTGQWSTLASQSGVNGSSAVMYRPGKILTNGTWTDTDQGDAPPITNRSAVLDLDQGVPAWRTVAPMKWARTYHTLTVLPDGDVLALGGQARFNANNLADSPVLQPEIWHPATDTWTPMASSVRPRGYHNSSLLLPDGRILLAGSGRLDGSTMVNETSAEIFSPPYLHKGARPSITSAPGVVNYGDGIEVTTPDAESIAKVSLVRIGAVTHNINMDQRWQQLSFRRDNGKLLIDGPTSPNIAPPGIYYLFILNGEGVPSKAAILSVPAGPGAPDTSAPTQVTGLQAANGVGRVSLNWNASTDNVGVTRYDVHRSATPDFTPSAATRIASVTSGTSHLDMPLAPGTYHYRVVAADAAGNASAPSAAVSAASTADTTAPAVALTAPAANATVRGTVTVSASASDDSGVAGVQFKFDGANLGAEDTAAPYTVAWDTLAAAAGTHTLTAVARDGAGNQQTATSVVVTVDNTVPAGPQPVAAYSFEDGTGTTLSDVTGKGHTGTIREATWSTAGRNGKALQFDGVNDWVTIDDAADLRMSRELTIEAWINPTSNSGWRTAVLKERSGDLAYALYSAGQARPSLYITNGSALSSTAAAVNTWTHVAATYDNASIKLYINGVQRASVANTNGLTASAGALRLGGNSVWGEYFAGKLDDVRIYDTALTAAQIVNDMNTPVGGQASPDTTPPSVPAGLTANAVGGSIALSWTASTDNVAVTRYAVHRSTTPNFTATAANRLATVTTGTSYTDANPADGTYYYRVSAEDAAGNASAASAQASAYVGPDIIAPTAPTGVSATDALGRVTLSWTAATDNVGVARYAVHRSTTPGFTPSAATRIAAVTATGYTDAALAEGTYVYRVVAEDAAGNATASAEVTGRSLGDTSPPTAPTNLTATGALGRVTLSWSAASDNVGVTRYAVHRSTSAGFTPSAANRIAYTASTGYADEGLAAGAYRYRVVAEDAAGNTGPASAEVSGTSIADAPPSVAVTAPGAGATVRGSVSVTANASDDVGVAGVQFKLDGTDLGAEDTAAPYSVTWDTTAATAGAHTLTAIARDSSGKRTTSGAVGVTVDNSVPAGPQPVAAYSFEDGIGSTLTDRTGKGHTGTIREAVWTTAGRNGKALQFDGVNDWVTIDDAADLRLTGALTLEAWVYPTSVSGWRTALLKERSGDLAYALYASGSPRSSLYVTSGFVQSGTALAVNTWSHLAATYDGTTLRVYVNGVQRGTATLSNGLTASAGVLRLGGNGVWGEYFAGRLDDVRIYDTALSAAQVTTNMTTSVN